jgi:hypothetical protein
MSTVTDLHSTVVNSLGKVKRITTHEPRRVITLLNYYNDPGDGSPPTPVIAGG